LRQKTSSFVIKILGIKFNKNYFCSLITDVMTIWGRSVLTASGIS